MAKKVINKASKCVSCKRMVSFENSQPAVGVAGRVHKLGQGCKKQAQQVMKVEHKTKPALRSFEEMQDFAKGIIVLSSGLECKLPRHKQPLQKMTIGGCLEFVPKNQIAPAIGVS